MRGYTAPDAASHAAAASRKPDVVDTLVSGLFFESLINALKTTGLDQALRGAGPFTVFAPTDEALAKVPAGAFDDRIALQSILKFHVVPGRYMAADVANLRSAATLSGERLPVEVAEGRVTVGGARILKTDIVAGNGIVHVVDRALMPKFV